MTITTCLILWMPAGGAGVTGALTTPAAKASGGLCTAALQPPPRASDSRAIRGSRSARLRRRMTHAQTPRASEVARAVREQSVGPRMKGQVGADQPDISVIVVNYRSAELTMRAVD